MTKELKITKAERDALLRVRDGLMRGTLRHDPSAALNASRGKVKGHKFNMATVYEKNDCGTAACIAGWMYAAMKQNATQVGACTYACRSEGGLHDLFHPYVLDHWEEITAENAVTAIHNALNFGDPDWPSVRPDLINPEKYELARDAGDMP